MRESPSLVWNLPWSKPLARHAATIAADGSAGNLHRHIEALVTRGDAIDREMQRIRKEISHKRYRKNRIFRRNRRKRTRIAYEINQLDTTLEQLAVMRKGVEVQLHVLTKLLDAH